MKIAALGVLFSILLAASLPFRADAGPNTRYRLVNLNTMPGSRYSSASRINNRGEIAGIVSIRNNTVPFLYTTDGVMHELPLTPGAYGPEIFDLNDRGQVLIHVGYSAVIDHTSVSDTTLLADLLQVVDVKSVVGRPIALGFALNNPGDIIGADLRDDFRYHPFLFSNGIFRLLDSGSTAPIWVQAVDINDSGSILLAAGVTVGTQVVSRAFILSNGTMTDIGALPGGIGAWGSRINNRGHVLGMSQAGPDVIHSFLWQDGHMTDLGDATFYDLNNNDDIVGQTADGQPVLFTEGTLQPLAPLIAGGPQKEFQIRGINDAGEMVGFATQHRQTHAILVTP